MSLPQIHRVCIIEDNEELSAVLCEYIKSNDNLLLAGCYNTCEEALKDLAENKPKIVLMDIDLPGMNGVQGTKRIKKRSPSTEIIIVTVFENSETVFSALCAGAAGYLTKNVTRLDLLSAIDECLAGGAPMSMKIARLVISSFKKNTKSPLTERETEVLSGLASGKTYNSIALSLNISKDTVKFHIKSIYIKLEVDNKEAAIEIANKEKFI